MSSSVSSEDSPSSTCSTPIVHVRADSDSTLEALFDVALKPPGSTRPLQVPLRMRNLPESFFRQPLGGGNINVINNNPTTTTILNGVGLNGGKLSSCSPSSSVHHSRENSLDSTSTTSSSSHHPSSQHQQMYIHSRAHSSPASLQQTLSVAHGGLRVGPQDADMGPLPPGWEVAKTPQGQLYYMNHIMKTTQWEDPRKQILQQQQQQQQQLLQSSSSPRSVSPISCHNRNSNEQLHTPSGPLPTGWDQSETPEGEIYFINHATKKTTWFDPRIPIHHQRVPVQQKDAAQRLLQDMRLQRLENERRALQQRQAELKKYMEKTEQIKLMKQQNQEVLQQTQEMLMRQSLNGNEDNPSSPSFNNNPQTNSASSSPSIVAQSEIHNRQESADSGLGMGSNFNLGSIPEDITGMEMDTDLDTTLTDQNPPGNPSNSAGSGGDSNSANNNEMDSDQLIPSLTGDLGDELSNDIMQDVQSILSTNKGDNLTWL